MLCCDLILIGKVTTTVSSVLLKLLMSIFVCVLLDCIYLW